MRIPAEFANQVHQRLLAKDPVAPAELAEAFLEPLLRRLRARFPYIRDEALLHDAVTDALLDYAEHPWRFNPSRSSLLSYLTMSARGDLLNALEKQTTQARREISLESVEQSVGDRNRLVEGVRGAAQEAPDPAEVAEDLLQQALELVPDTLDRQFLDLMLDGERRTAAYSAVLGIGHLDMVEQRRTVKRHRSYAVEAVARYKTALRLSVATYPSA